MPSVPLWTKLMSQGLSSARPLSTHEHTVACEALTHAKLRPRPASALEPTMPTLNSSPTLPDPASVVSSHKTTFYERKNVSRYHETLTKPLSYPIASAYVGATCPAAWNTTDEAINAGCLQPSPRSGNRHCGKWRHIGGNKASESHKCAN